MSAARDAAALAAPSASAGRSGILLMLLFRPKKPLIGYSRD